MADSVVRGQRATSGWLHRKQWVGCITDTWQTDTSGGVGGMINEADSDGDGQIHCQVFSKAIHSAAFDDL
ncbi:hypothetical protein YC2023_059854 [Brassica napus]